MTVIPFKPTVRPRVILDCGTVTRSNEFPIGATIFWLDYEEGDLSATVWTGQSYEAARSFARDLEKDGARLVDRTLNQS